ncbi:S8 family serine peptidase [bacterium]|nr:S8 family serine peptidase [bacterium]
MKKTFTLLLLAASISVFADPGLIRLRENVIDTSAPQTQSVLTPKCQSTASGKYQYLIQPAKNFSTEEMKMIEDSGIVFVGIIPPNAYQILAGANELEALKEQTELLYVGEFLPEYKTTGASRIAMAEKKEPFSALIVIASKAEYEEVAKLLPGCKTICENPMILEAEVTEGKISQLTKLSAVVNVEEASKFTINNDVSKTTNLMNVEDVNRSGYTGKGVKVCVADTGLDSGNPDDIHPDFQNKEVTGVICSANTGRDDWSDLNGHGTHVSGSVLGTGSFYSQYAGMAPDASLYFICCGDSGNGIALPVEKDVKGAYDAGARIMSNSWGNHRNGNYDTTSVMWDGFASKYPDMLILFSAGNDNESINTENNSTLSSTASCKNVLTVAAAESYRSDSGTYGDLFGAREGSVFYRDRVAFPSDGNNQGMAMFSSRGPTTDGRAKPDICAPGTLIESTESIFDSYNKGNRSRYYTQMSGTSMSTPLTAGACADILQFLIENGVEKPSSALVKAVLINGARTMGTGQYKNVVEIPDISPNCVNGFGHVNLKESVDPESGELFFFEGSLKNTGDEATYTFEKRWSGPANFTLCWTDATGSISAQKALVNDLDLTVTVDETTYLPNGLESGSDSINNVEKFHMDVFPTGNNIEVKIKGANIMKGPQKFALAVSGMDEFIPEPSLAFASLIFVLLLARKR